MSDAEQDSINESKKILLKKIISYLEESVRASTDVGLEYIDLKDYKNRFLNLQNHVIYGRRGAGKSALIRVSQKEVDESPQETNYPILIGINLEDYKDISFPNIIIQALSQVMERLSETASKSLPFWEKIFLFKKEMLIKRVKNYAEELKYYLDEPDNFNQEEIAKQTNTIDASISANNPLLSASTEVKIGKSGQYENEQKREVSFSKLDMLKKEIPSCKSLLKQISSEILKGRKIFLIFDDFYFVDKSIQPHFIDFFHRLTKDTPLFLKVATIKHRSILYTTAGNSFIGTELNNDIFAIDLDYTLDNFQSLVEFMNLIVRNIEKKFEASGIISSLFVGDSFSQLCLASGGVPRDFLSQLITLMKRITDESIDRIQKVDVNESAIANAVFKRQSFNTDSADEKNILERYLNWIVEFVLTQKRQNTFLIAKEEMEKFPNERQAIRELVDLRFIHLIESNISAAPSDGRIYEAYLIDVGLYPNSRLRDFKQIDPSQVDEKSRKDDLRASPRVSLAKMKDEIGETMLKVTE